MDRTLNAEVRSNRLLSQMTLDEKLAQLNAFYIGKTPAGVNAEISDLTLDSLFSLGMGQVCQPGKRRSPAEIVRISNRIQKYLVEKTRLSIPAFMHEEGLHGMIANGVSSFPVPIGMSCSWNPELMNQCYDRIGREMRISGLQVCLSPVLDVAREPRWGRFEETFGEDPYLVSSMAVATVSGYQGGKRMVDSVHVVAMGKHFCGYGYPEGGHNIAPSMISPNELYNVHLRSFRKAIKEAHLWSIMPSYNEINATPSHANDWLLTRVLRKELAFDGMVCADYGGVRELMVHHNVAANEKEAALLAFKAGVDFDLPNNSCYRYLKELIQEGKIKEKELDEKVRRILYIKFMTGLFDHPFADSTKATDFVGNSDGVALVNQIARESVVLLKNDKKILPLNISVLKRIAVIGPNADVCELGAYYGSPKYIITPLQGLQKRFANELQILYSTGCRITYEKIDTFIQKKVNKEDPDKIDIRKKTLLPTIEEEEASLNEAYIKAKQSDIVLLFIGGNMTITRESFYGSPLGDRSDLRFTPAQRELFFRMKRSGKPVVLCMVHGGPIADPEIFAQADAVIDFHYSGQETGTVVAEILTGDVNPSGKLSYTVPVSASQLPCFYNYKPSARRGYAFIDVNYSYPFGFGLSYTTFAISQPNLNKTAMGRFDTCVYTVKLKNTGTRSGSEVVQLYMHDKVSTATRPVKELIAYKKVSLKAGEEQLVKFVIPASSFAYFNAELKNVIEPGEYELMAGTSSIDLNKPVIVTIR